MALDWRTAYLNQAKSDYAIYLELLKLNVPRCQQFHYLQMATEKLAKSVLCPEDGDRPIKSHNAFEELVRRSRARQDLRRQIGRFKSQDHFRDYINSLLPRAKDVEDLSPEGPDHPNPEYPWEAGGAIYSPLEYDFLLLDPKRDAKMQKLMTFIVGWFKLTDEWSTVV